MRRIAIAFALTMTSMPVVHASEWAGSSLSLRTSSNGMYCTSGAVRLSIDGDNVYGSAGSGVSLAGRIAKNGSISLEGGAGAKRVSFTGKKEGERIRGAWIEALTGCGGTWRAEMVAADSPAVQPMTPHDGSDDASIFMEQPDEVPPDETGAGEGNQPAQ